MQTRSARADESPRSRTPFTPVSAPLTNSRASPKPWEGRAGATTPTQNTIERASTPKTDEPRSAGAVIYGHRRGYSESGSIMDRGRPKKRPERAAPNFTFNPGAALNRSNSGSLKRTDSKKRSKSAERKAFEQLPKGWKSSEVCNCLSPTEISDLQKQAFGQAARFEILRKDDVEALSRVRFSNPIFCPTVSPSTN